MGFEDLTAISDKESVVVMTMLLSQLETARAVVDDAERRAVGIRKVIDGLVEMFPALWDMLPEDLDNADQPIPRGSMAVYRLLLRDRGEWHTVGGVVNLLQREGWAPDSANPANAVRTALERLVEREEVEKTRSTDGAVIYRVPSPNFDAEEEPF